MGADTTTNRDDVLLRVYSREGFYEPCERSQPRFWDQMEEADDEAPRGKGRFFRIVGALSHAAGNPAEGGDWTEAGQPLEVECHVTSSQIDFGVELSAKFLEATKEDGAYVDAEHENIVYAAKGLFSYADRLLGCGHGTGRLAVVAASSGPSTSITVDLPESVFQLRRNQPVDFVDLDTGGTVQATARIRSVDYQTRVVILDTAVTVTAGWGIYQAGVYGNPMPNGLFNLVDDGDFSSTFCNQSRTAPNDFLNATVMDGTGGLQDYSEELVNELLDQITFNQDLIPTQLRANMGILNEHKRVTVPDRMYIVDKRSADPGYNTGVNHEELAHAYGNVKIPFKYDRNLPARNLFALYMPGFRKHTLRKADWFKGKGGAILQIKPALGGGTYSYSLIGAMMVDMTISHRKPNANGKASNIRDRSAARDS